MDRIDLHVDVQEIEHTQLLSAGHGNDDAVRARVAKARNIQQKRFSSPVKLNADMTNRDIKTKSRLAPEAMSMLNEAAKTMGLSARSYMRVIKVARSIADLEESDQITTEHIAEALQYRGRNLKRLL